MRLIASTCALAMPMCLRFATVALAYANDAGGGLVAGESGALAAQSADDGAPASGDVIYIRVYRMLDLYGGAHVYTTAAFERNSLVPRGRRCEEAFWFALESGEPLYRVYNPNSGPEADEQRVSVYRAFNPGSGFHHLTMQEGERYALVGFGWRNEGAAFYVSPLDPEFEDGLEVRKPRISGNSDLQHDIGGDWYIRTYSNPPTTYGSRQIYQPTERKAGEVQRTFYQLVVVLVGSRNSTLEVP